MPKFPHNFEPQLLLLHPPRLVTSLTSNGESPHILQTDAQITNGAGGIARYSRVIEMIPIWRRNPEDKRTPWLLRPAVESNVGAQGGTASVSALECVCFRQDGLLIIVACSITYTCSEALAIACYLEHNVKLGRFRRLSNPDDWCLTINCAHCKERLETLVRFCSEKRSVGTSLWLPFARVLNLIQSLLQPTSVAY